MSTNSIGLIEEFIRSFNEQDLDAFVDTLHPAVELHSGRGIRRGIISAREWATKKPGGVQQTIVLDGLSQPEADECSLVVACVTRNWHWADEGSPAGSEEMEWLFVLDGGRVRSWQPFDRRGEALEQLTATSALSI